MKKIPIFPNIDSCQITNHPQYWIYSDGQVYSEKRNIFLKTWTDQKGYKVTNIEKEHKVKIHRLVALHFLPNTNQARNVIHLNNDLTDNRVENLAWGKGSIQVLIKDLMQWINENKHFCSGSQWAIDREILLKKLQSYL